MTVSITTLPVSYPGDGGTVLWPFSFEVIDDTEIRLHITDPDGAITAVTSGFTVDLVEGEVTYPVDPQLVDILPVDWKITISRSTAREQEINLVNGGPMDSEVIEEGYDKLTRMIQEVDENLSRCIQIPIGRDRVADDTDPLSLSDAATLASIAAAAAASASAGAALASEASAAQSAVDAQVSADAAYASAGAAAAVSSADFLKVGTFATIDGIAAGSPFLAILTDQRVISMYLGNRALGQNGWSYIGGY